MAFCDRCHREVGAGELEPLLTSMVCRRCRADIVALTPPHPLVRALRWLLRRP